MIQLLLIVYTLIAAWVSYYLLTHQTRCFLIFDPTRNPAVKTTARVGGSCMLLVAIGSAVTIFTQSTVWIAIVLAAGCLVMMAIGLVLVSFMQI